MAFHRYYIYSVGNIFHHAHTHTHTHTPQVSPVTDVYGITY